MKKRVVQIVGLLATVTIIGIGAYLIFFNKVSELQLPFLMQNFNSSIYENQKVVVGDYASYQSSNELANLIQIEEWEKTNKPISVTTLIMTIELSELYEIRLYEDGYACVYYGYANPWERDTAWYRLPDGTADAVETYIEGLTP